MRDTAVLNLTAEDPVDAVSRLLAIVQRCSIELVSLSVEQHPGPVDSGRFAIRVVMRAPLPFEPAHLADRVRQIPFVEGVDAYVGTCGIRFAADSGAVLLGMSAAN